MKCVHLLNTFIIQYTFIKYCKIHLFQYAFIQITFCDNNLEKKSNKLYQRYYFDLPAHYELMSSDMKLILVI